MSSPTAEPAERLVCDRRRLLAGGVGALALTGVPRSAAASPTEQALAALRPNQSVLLGNAAIDGDFNATARRFDLHRTGPRARNYCLKMVWSPSRRTAIYLGANHGQPHRLNDVWEFDLAALRWTLLYAPDLPRDYKGLGPDASDVEFRDGILQTRRGGPAIIGHTWSGITYDTTLDRVLFMNAWVTDVAAAIQRVGGDPAKRYPGPPVWSFDPRTRRWLPVISPLPHPRVALGALMEFVPELGGSIWHMNNWRMRQTWLYVAAQNRWQDLDANGGGEAFKREAPVAELVGYHDPLRKLVVCRVGTGTHHFDTQARRWTAVETRGVDAAAVPRGHTARTSFGYERVSGLGVLFDTASRSLWTYRPQDAVWSALQPQGPPMPDGRRPLCYVDPLRAVVVVIDDRTVWAYRLPAG